MDSRSAWSIQWNPFTNKYKASKNQPTVPESPAHLDSFIPCIPMYSGLHILFFFLRRHIYDHILFSLSFEREKGHLSHLSVYWGQDTVWGRGSGVRFPPPCFAQGQKNQIGSLSVSVSLPQFCPKNRDEKLHGIASEKLSLEEKARKHTLMDFMCLKEVA